MKKEIIVLWYLLLAISVRCIAQSQAIQQRQQMLLDAADENATNLMFIAENLVKEHKYPDALAVYSKAAAQYNQRKAYKEYAEAVLKMSDVHYLMKNYTIAEQSVINVALKSFGKVSDKNGMMRCYQSLGNIYIGMKKPVQSLWFFAQQGNIAEQINDQISLTESLLSVATVKIIRRQYALANKDLIELEERIVRLHQEDTYAALITRMKKMVQAKMPLR